MLAIMSVGVFAAPTAAADVTFNHMDYVLFA